MLPSSSQRRLLLVAAALVPLGGCLHGEARSGHDRLARLVSEPAPPPAAEKPSGPPPGAPALPTSSRATSIDQAAGGGQQTGRSARSIDELVALALARNPELAERRARVREVLARVRAAARLPDPELMFQVWNPPIARPYAWNEADNIMFGLRQRFPLGGKLSAEARAALGEAEVAVARLREKIEAVRARVVRAYAMAVWAETDYALHREHVDLVARMVEVARDRLEASRTTQADLLRTLVDLSRLHADIAHIDQERRSARARLNAAIGREVDTPITVSLEPPVRARIARLAELEARQQAHQPTLAMARKAVELEQARLRAAEKVALAPDLALGADYWLNPARRDGYALMVGLTLPWLNPGHRERREAARQALAATRARAESVRLETAFRLRDAHARVEAAERLLRVLEEDLLRRAEQSFEAARAHYASVGGDINALLDARRVLLQVKLDLARARQHYVENLAELRRVVGTDIGAAAPATDSGAAAPAGGRP